MMLPALPLTTTFKIRILLFLVVLLSIAAGIYKDKATTQEKLYNKLEDRYVRVRSQLGVEETQRLIDESYNKE